MEVKLQSGEQIVDLERNGYKIIQNRERFCFGMDAVLLTGFAKVGKGERALDLGTGTGIMVEALCHIEYWNYSNIT